MLHFAPRTDVAGRVQNIRCGGLSTDGRRVISGVCGAAAATDTRTTADQAVTAVLILGCETDGGDGLWWGCRSIGQLLYVVSVIVGALERRE